jgi:acetyl-CoA C-acetyltransferase
MREEVLITTARRTPIGGFQGTLSSLPATQLGMAVVRAVVADAGVLVERIDEVCLGCVLQAGVGQGPARQAALGGGTLAGGMESMSNAPYLPLKAREAYRNGTRQGLRSYVLPCIAGPV